MSDGDNLLDIMAELRAKCEKLGPTPMDQREPVRDRIGDLLAAYMKIMVPEPQLTKLKTQENADFDARLTRILIDMLGDHERRAGVSIAELDRVMRRLLKPEGDS